MYSGKTIALLIPARNEALSLPHVLHDLPAGIDRVLVVDNGSTDATARVAEKCGAAVVRAAEAGYGRACLAGLKFLSGNPPDIIAFADGDGSDDLTRLPELIALITTEGADLAIERRIPVHTGAMSPQQRFGNRLATTLIRLIWQHRFADLGPMRAIPWETLQRLGMRDETFGWTVEMQIRAVKAGLQIREYPLPYRTRKAGQSKISRTFRGTVRAGLRILWVIFREAALMPAGKGKTLALPASTRS